VPKYTYEKGSTAQLYNAHKIKQHSIIIVEGELDALRLESSGYLAVTSTGGSGTFKDEWLPLLKDKDIYVCYDNDDAGMKGATKLLTKLKAKLVIIPRQQGVKDATDFLVHGGSFPILLERAQSFPVLSEPIPEFKYIKDIEAVIKKYKYALEHLLVQERNAKNKQQAFIHFDYIRQLLLTAINNLYREIRKMKYFKKPVKTDGEGKITNEDVLRAKEVPIETLFTGQLRKMGGRATGNCPFHNESESSFTIYLQSNTFWCYGCSAGVDSIDYVMRRDGCGFIEAVKKMINK
jgi:DNA primase